MRGILAIVVGAAALVLASPAFAQVTATFSAGQLTVTGNADVNEVAVTCEDDDVLVWDGGSTLAIPGGPVACANVDLIDVSTGAEHDDIDLTAVLADSFPALIETHVDGGADGDRLRGSEGVDFLRGGAGADTLEESPGEDDLDGGSDDDALVVWGSDDAEQLVVTATSLNDEVRNEQNAIAALEIFSFSLGLGDNSVDASAGPGRYQLFGGENADTFVGGALDDEFDGGDGDDVLDGGPGDDTLTGGAGDDDLRPGGGTDTIDGGADYDRLMLAGTIDADELTILGASLTLGGETSSYVGIDFIQFTGDDGDDTVDGSSSSAPMELAGGHGVDTLIGGVDDDRLSGDDGLDTLTGGPGGDELDGGPDDDLVHGSSGDDTLHLASGGDDLSGDNDSDLYLVTLGDIGTATAFDTGVAGVDRLTLDAAHCAGATVTDLELSKGSDRVEYEGLEVFPCSFVPGTTIDAGPSGTTEATTAIFTFSSLQGTHDCKLDSAAFAPCTSPATYTGLSVGSHTFTVRARNPLGSLGTPATRTWTIVAPVTPPPPPPAPPRKPTVKKKVVKITVCHKRKTKKVTKAQLKKLKGAKRGACKPKKKTTKKR